MKALAFTIAFAVVGFGLCYGLFYIVGVLGGPFHQGEDDAARNVKIFLAASAGSILAGGFIGFLLGKSTTDLQSTSSNA